VFCRKAELPTHTKESNSMKCQGGQIGSSSMTNLLGDGETRACVRYMDKLCRCH
jgi:hypothetical protein